MAERLPPQYRFDTASGRWHHRDGAVEPPLRLSMLTYDADGILQYPEHHDVADESALATYLAEAHAMLTSLSEDLGEPAHDGISEDFASLQWFDLPAVCLLDLDADLR